VFYEPIAKITREHIRLHLPAYLTKVNTFHDRALKLDLPQRFDISTIVGGTVGVSRKTLPAFAITAFERVFSNSDEDVWTYVYPGQISGMVASTESAEMAESLARRYAGAMEMFINDHRERPVLTGFDQSALAFRFKGLGYTRTEFFGAANVEEEKLNVWIDGFRIDLLWELIEAGPGQHG
jgi:hypothetical protein